MRISTSYVEWCHSYFPSVPITARTLPRLYHHHFFPSKSIVNRHAHPPRGSCSGLHYCTIAELQGRLCKITESLNQNIRHPRRNSKQLPSEYVRIFTTLFKLQIKCQTNSAQKMLLYITLFFKDLYLVVECLKTI
jgi:hypothetical protein